MLLTQTMANNLPHGSGHVVVIYLHDKSVIFTISVIFIISLQKMLKQSETPGGRTPAARVVVAVRVARFATWVGHLERALCYSC